VLFSADVDWLGNLYGIQAAESERQELQHSKLLSNLPLVQSAKVSASDLTRFTKEVQPTAEQHTDSSGKSLVITESAQKNVSAQQWLIQIGERISASEAVETLYLPVDSERNLRVTESQVISELELLSGSAIVSAWQENLSDKARIVTYDERVTTRISEDKPSSSSAFTLSLSERTIQTLTGTTVEHGAIVIALDAQAEMPLDNRDGPGTVYLVTTLDDMGVGSLRAVGSTSNTDWDGH